MTSYSEALNIIADMIKACDSVIILTHRRPDGDAVGSSYALAAAANRLGKRAKIFFSEDLQKKYSFLFGAGEDEPQGRVCVIAVDAANAEMITVDPALYGGAIDACIDHHKTNNGWAPVSCVRTYSSCGECVLDLIDILGVELDDYIAKAIYIAVSTDTGCFKFGNTDAHTHRTAARLFEAAEGLDKLNNDFFIVKSAKKKALEYTIHSKMTFFADGKGAISSMTTDELTSIGASYADLDDVSDTVRTTEGVLIGAMLKETSNDSYRVSMRGNSDAVDVSEICAEFGGGGHKGAGGCTVEGTEDEVRGRVQEAIENYLSKAGMA